MPLTGIRALDLSRGLVGPFASQLLADFGCEVIKVEDIEGDTNRNLYPPFAGNENALFYAVNRNKKSLALDLRQPEGKLILKKLTAQSDIFIENFKPGTTAKWGLDYEQLKKENPGLIYCAVSAFGATGPFTNIPGHDLNILSMSGITFLTGQKGGEPTIMPVQLAANVGSLYAVVAILMALQQRQKTGQGQFCDISLLDGSISLLAYALAAWSETNKLPERGNGYISGGYASYQIYTTRDGKYMSLAATEPHFWQIFCERLNIPHFISWQRIPDTNKQQEMINTISDLIIEKSQQEWMELFSDINLCFTPVLDLEAMSESPQVAARNMVISLDNFAGSGKELKLAGIPIKMSASPGQMNPTFSRLGQHSQELLAEAGFSQTEIMSLAENKTIII